MVKFLAMCAIGLEETVLLEFKKQDINIDSIEIFNGIILFEYKDNPKNLLELKTVDDIQFLVKKFSNITRYNKSLWEIRKQLSNVNLQKILFLVRKIRLTKKEINFSIKSSYKDRLDYTAKDITICVKRIIKRNYNWKFNEKEFGELHFSINLNKDISICSVSIDDLPYHVKNRIKTIPGSLKSSVANALLFLAQIDKKSIVFDPMCGSGIIAIEVSKDCAKIIASDNDKNSINIAIDNNLIKKTNVEFQNWDAKKTKLENKSIDRIICNLPFDKQVEMEDTFIKKFLEEMLRISKNNFTWVFLTRHDEFIIEEINKLQLKIEKSINIINSGLKSTILIIKRQ